MRFIPLRLFLPVFIILALSVSSCQDDPNLEPTPAEDALLNPRTKAFITMVRVNEFPAVDPNGDSWDVADTVNGDPFGRPDIFFNFTIPDPEPPVIWSQLSHFSESAPEDSTTFFLLDEFEVVPFGSSIDVNVYDFELPDSTLMGTVNFVIGPVPDPENPYPGFITSSANGYSITLGIRWEE